MTEAAGGDTREMWPEAETEHLHTAGHHGSGWTWPEAEGEATGSVGACVQEDLPLLHRGTCGNQWDTSRLTGRAIVVDRTEHKGTVPFK